MTDTGAIDLHTHSNRSDGTDSPAALMRAAADAGLSVIALTDHDATAGWTEAATALPPGLTLLPGLELSAATEEHGATIPIHLLGYLVDPDDPALVAELAAVVESRLRRAERILGAMVADGHPVSWERTRARAQGTVGRPHIASELLAAGLVGSVAEAFTDEWIGSGGRYYRSERKVPALQALSIIQGAGGVAVFAHPGASLRGEIVSDDTIAAMAQAGLAGLEVEHPDHDAPTRTRLRELAADLNLFTTGGSDYHGDRKDTRLGQETTRREVFERITSAGSGCAPASG